MKRTVYYGGDILTLEGGGRAEALLVEDGVIRELGTKEALLASFPGAERADLRGRTLMPSFIDPHSHITSCAQTFGLVSLEGCREIAEVVKRIADYREKGRVKPGEWICGFGYDHNDLKERRHPGREALDRAAPDNPVLISHASGHMGAVNSAALREMGITADTPDPDGGRIGRVDASREPDGYLEETAFISRSNAVPLPSEEERFRQMEMAQDAYLRYGITTAQDGLTRPAEWELLKGMSEAGKLRLDVVSYLDQKQCPGLLRENPEWYGRYRGNLRIGGYKIFLDGSPQGRTAWVSEPYEGAADGYRGYPSYTDEQLEAFVRQAVDERVQQLVHCNGDAACGQLIGAYQKVAGGDLGLRPVMIHAQLVREDQLAEMAKLGMIASFFVAHTWFWGDVHLKNFGAARAEKISPAASALREGVVYTFHQDTPVIQPDMLFTVWCAVNRRTRAGVVLGPEERLSVTDALRGVTANAAYQYFEEDRKGTIRAGKRADLVVLDRNPLDVPAEELKNLRVLATIKAGEPLYRKE